MRIILQNHIPFTAAETLPGIQPVQEDDWLWVDDAYDAQMALRDELIAEQPAAVHALEPSAMPAAQELLQMVLAKLKVTDGYQVEESHVVRPDGVTVAVDDRQPLLTLGRLHQADYCLLEKPEGSNEHILTGAILCFPSSWMLSEKAGRPLTDIHVPVPEYDEMIAKRVQRLFDGVQVGRPLWRANRLWHNNPALHQPKSKLAPRRPEDAGAAYFRSERQVILRLPETRAVVFSIHTFVVENEKALG